MKVSLYQRIRNFAHSHAFVFPLILLVETFISYGTMGLLCGFYWDDWPPVLLSNIAKTSIFWTTFTDRPFSAWTFTLMFPLLHNSAMAWQIATILIRWLGVYLFYLVLVNLFPKQRTLFQWASLLAIVLPVFQYQYISVAFSQHFLTYAIFAGSLYLLVLSIKSPRYFWLFYPLSLLLAAAHIFMMEYFVGLEILRPLVLLLSLKAFGGKEVKKLWSKAILVYLPYLVILLGYLYWRFKVYPEMFQVSASFSNTPFLLHNLLSDPVNTLENLVNTVLQDVRFTFLSSWLDRLWPADLQVESKMMWFSLLMGALGSGLFWLFFGEANEEEAPLTKGEFWRNLGLGLVIFLFGTAPVWVTLRQISAGKYSERFALAAIPGIVLIIASIFWVAVRRPHRRSLILSGLVLLAISFQIQMGSDMKKDFDLQQNFYSQLGWRVPELKPGTGIYSPGIISQYEADYSYSMGINLLYNGESEDTLDYWFFSPRDYAVTDLINDPGLVLHGLIRGPEFTGKSTEMIAIYQSGSNCLLVLDPVYSQLNIKVADFKQYGALTNFAQIGAGSSATMYFPQAFGKISTHNWCYYFEKADLARQQKDWGKVIDLYDQAKAAGFTPVHSIEYIPLIDALAEQGQVQQALDVTNQAIALSDTIVPPACTLWQNLIKENAGITAIQVTAALGAKTCSW